MGGAGDMAVERRRERIRALMARHMVRLMRDEGLLPCALPFLLLAWLSSLPERKRAIVLDAIGESG